MDTAIDERIDVGVVFTKSKLIPKFFCWRGRAFHIQEVTLTHKVRQGNVPWYFFSVVSRGSLYRLGFDSVSFSWILDRVVPMETT
ncbi:MAG: hypothetical protein Q8R11_01185 [bacterium]|nr:hypothetical protein [bacterium]